VQLVHSRDGRHWQRSSDRSPVIPLGPHAYDTGSIFGLCNSPVIVGDEMWMYYPPRPRHTGGLAPEKEQSIARAVWRIDGLASLRAKEALGFIETHDFIAEGGHLSVNADIAKGHLSVEVLDASGKTLAGYEKESSATENADSVKLSDPLESTRNLALSDTHPPAFSSAERGPF